MTSEDPTTLNQDPMQSWIRCCTLLGGGYVLLVLPVRTLGRRVQNSTRKPEVADDIIYSARVQIHVILRMSTLCVKEGVHCGVTMETLPDRVPVENYPNLLCEENATRLSPNRVLDIPWAVFPRHAWHVP